MVASLDILAQIGAEYRYNLSDVPLFNKYTGEKISDKDFEKMVEENPSIMLIPQINELGVIWSFNADPKNKSLIAFRDTSLRVKPTEEFLPFKMKTMDGERLDSDNLKGKNILIHCQLYLKPPLFVEKSFNEISEIVKSKSESGDIIFIVLTESDKHDINDGFEKICENVKIVPDSRNFMIRYLINSYPSNILIDKNGDLVSYYESFEFEKLKKDLSEL